MVVLVVVAVVHFDDDTGESSSPYLKHPYLHSGTSEHCQCAFAFNSVVRMTPYKLPS